MVFLFYSTRGKPPRGVKVDDGGAVPPGFGKRHLERLKLGLDGPILSRKSRAESDHEPVVNCNAPALVGEEQLMRAFAFAGTGEKSGPRPYRRIKPRMKPIRRGDRPVPVRS
jgi:hypothetical protein